MRKRPRATLYMQLRDAVWRPISVGGPTTIAGERSVVAAALALTGARVEIVRWGSWEIESTVAPYQVAANAGKVTVRLAVETP